MHGRTRKSVSGLALTEYVILGALTCLVFGMTVPVVNEHLAAEARARALSDLRRLSSDMMAYRRDTGKWPRTARFAFSDGTAAGAEEVAFGFAHRGRHVSSFLAVNQSRVLRWNGPYMNVSRPDPWGHRYVVVLEGLGSPLSPYGWILSAGPDGIFQTGRWDRLVQGDDLGLLLR